MEERLQLNRILTKPADASAEDRCPFGKRSSKTLPEDEVTGLFDQLRTPLVRYVMSFGLSPQDGEEVIQEVFLSLFQHLRSGKPGHNLRGWVFRVAHNLGLKRCYANRQKLSLISCPDDRIAELGCDRNPDPEGELASRQRHKRLLAIFRALPAQDQRCLYLRAEGLRYREIAEVLGISLGGVALSLERSLRRLAAADGR